MKKVLLIVLLICFAMPAFAGDFVAETEIRAVRVMETVNLVEGEKYQDKSVSVLNALTKTCPAGYTARVTVRIKAVLTPVEA